MNKRFSSDDQHALLELLTHRRDVRGNRFVDAPISDESLDQILNAATLAPSVGYSQPWEFVIIRERQTKEQIASIFEQENAKAQTIFNSAEAGNAKAKHYAELKLEGILATPVNIAVFYKPRSGPVLGQTSMDEVGEYSVVCAIQNMWLMSRAMNIGMGWVSILDSEQVKRVLNAPKGHKLVAYLCLGEVDRFLDQPELEQLKWESRKPLASALIQERYR